MADIHANGKMTASITVGTYSGMNRSELDELLSTKADVEHTHDEYLTQHQDISHLATKGELEEVKTSVSNGKTLLASAITDKGVETLATDSFETMANNIKEIITSEEPIENPYYVEYRVAASDYALNKKVTNISPDMYGLPRIYSATDEFSHTYEKVEIILNDGSITDDLGTKSKDVYKIRLWYPENTIALKFYGDSTYSILVSIVDYIKTDNFTDMSYMFYFCPFLSYIDMVKSSFDTSKVTTMNNMFRDCPLLTSLELSSFNTGNVKSMYYMFYDCKALTKLDLSSFNTSSVTIMSYMFYGCTELGSLGLFNFDTSKVTNMSYMFQNCSKLTSLDLSNFDTSKVTNMSNMFSGCSNLSSLNLFKSNTNNVTDMSYMFNNCSKLTSLDLSNFDTSKVTNMSNMFSFGYSSKISRLIVPTWDMSKVTSYSSMFGSSLSYITNLKYIDLSSSNDDTITKIVTRLYARTEATYGEMLVPENTSQTVIDSMAAKYWKPIGPIIIPISFEIASDLDEIVGLDKVTKLYYGNCEPWYTDGEVEFVSSDDSIAYINENNELVSVAYGSVGVYGRLKEDNSKVSNTLTITVSETDSYPNVIKFRSDLTNPGTNNYITVNGTNVKLTAMSYNSLSKIYTYDVGAPITSIMFNGYSCKNVIAISTPAGYNNIKELIKLNTNNITTMDNMFSQCTALISIDLSSFNTNNVTSMRYMLFNCKSLTSLDLSNFDTSKVTDMYSMFNHCSSLTSLNVSNFNTSKVTDMSASDMFSDIPSTVDWHYDGTNYQNFTLTESQTSFSGTFPWNLD